MYNSTDEEHRRTARNEKIKSLLAEVSANLKKEEDDASQEVMNEKGEIIKTNKAKWEAAENDFKQDPRYIELKEENDTLKDKLRKSDR